MPRWRIACWAALPFLVLLFAWRWLGYVPPERSPYFAGRAFGAQPLVIAHQGGDGIVPGETLEAMRHAAALGADVLEMDVHASADGELVLLHDERVDRTTDGRGEVRRLAWRELAALDAGYDWPEGGREHPFRGAGLRIARLHEVLASFPAARFNIELKQVTEATARAVCTALRTHRAGPRTLVASFQDAPMQAFRQACPEVATSATPNEVRLFVVLSSLRLSRLYRSPAQALQVPRRASGITVLDANFVAQAHARGLAVDVWTVNTREEMREVAALGVDGIITDRPDLALAVRAPRAREAEDAPRAREAEDAPRARVAEDAPRARVAEDAPRAREAPDPPRAR